VSVIHKQVRLACPAHRAWQLFTVNSELESWLTTRADVEPWLGGKYELFWDADDPENDSTIGCRVTAIEPQQLLAFDWKGGRQHKAFMNEADPLTHVTICFVSAGANHVDVQLVHSGWRQSSEWNDARDWFERAWSEAFTRLAEHAAEGSPAETAQP
jgi:uncharacterized protein YndB with AHSA1/START domain